MKAGEEMPKKDAFAPHDGEQGVATGAHHADDFTVTQMHRLYIGRMHFQHIGIDQLENICPACLGPTVVMLENAASGQYERILLARSFSRWQIVDADKVRLPFWECLPMHQRCAFVRGSRHRPL